MLTSHSHLPARQGRQAQGLLQQCLQVRGKQAEAWPGKQGGVEQGGWTECPAHGGKIEIPWKDRFLAWKAVEGLF